MKILHVINDLRTGGAELLVVALAVHQARLGHSVSILSLGSPKSEVILNRAKAAGIEVLSCEWSTARNPITSLWSVYKYSRSFEIVHAHLFPAQLWVPLAARRKTLFTTEHSTVYRRRKHWLFRLIDKYMYTRFATIFCVSDAVSKSLSMLYPNIDRRCRVIENGIDREAVATALPLDRRILAPNLPSNSTLLVAVGRLAEVKDYETILHALALLPASYSLLIAGDGPLEGSLKKYAMKLSVEERVIFLGSRSDVPAILKTADAFVSASRWEGYGLSLAEATAAGIPTIVTDIPAHRILVGDTGNRFAVGDQEHLARLILALTDTPATPGHFAEVATSNLRGIADVAKEYISSYREVHHKVSHSE